eukprot:8861211-Pyramimonas_sp.AAC.1
MSNPAAQRQLRESDGWPWQRPQGGWRQGGGRSTAANWTCPACGCRKNKQNWGQCKQCWGYRPMPKFDYGSAPLAGVWAPQPSGTSGPPGHFMGHGQGRGGGLALRPGPQFMHDGKPSGGPPPPVQPPDEAKCKLLVETLTS